MNCSSCGHENRDSAKFCEECAAPLAQSCARGATQLRPGARFCDECAHPVGGAASQTAAGVSLGAGPGAPEAGESARSPRDYTPRHLAERIFASKSALEGERKQVTVLFADVKGSMELAEQVGPEGWHDVLDRFG